MSGRRTAGKRNAWLHRRALRGGRVRWDIRWRDLAGRPHSETLDPDFATKERNAALAAKVAELNGIGDVEDTTVQELAERYVASLADRSREHQKKTARALRDFVDRLPVVWLKDVTTSHVEDFRAALQKEGRGAATVDGRLLAVKGMMNYATKHTPPLLRPGMNPASSVGLLNNAKAVKTIWTLEQINQIIDKAPDAAWKALLIVAARTGLRKGDLYGLEWDANRVDFNEGTIFVRENKTNAEHTVYIGEAGAKVLRELRAEHPQSTRVFEGITWHAMHEVLPGIVKAALGDAAGGDSRQRWHCFRRSCFTHLAAQHPEAVVQALSGHKSYATTAKYYIGQMDAVARQAAEDTFGAVAGCKREDGKARKNQKQSGEYVVNQTAGFRPHWVKAV